jgi:alpha-beta hydrolase superfamily lysophospholipase
MPLEAEREIPHPVRNRSGEMLAGVLHEPCKQSDTLIIAVHGFLSHKDHLIIRQACADLCRAGYKAYRFDLSGNGASEGRFEDATPMKMLGDLLAVIEHFQQMGCYKRIILLGHSLGGALATVAASRAEVQGLLLIAPASRPERAESLLSPAQLEQLRSVGFTIMMVRKSVCDVPFTITERFMQETRELRPIDAAPQVRCPALLIHGTADRIVPLEDAEALIAALPSKDLFIIGGADHNITTPAHFDAMMARMVEWLRQR